MNEQVVAALKFDIEHFSSDYWSAVAEDLIILERVLGSKGVLSSQPEEESLAGAAIEQQFMHLRRARRGFYRSISFFNRAGEEKILVNRDRRGGAYEPPANSPQNHLNYEAYTTLFQKLKSSKPGTILSSGPLKSADNSSFFIAGISMREPATVDFGGVTFVCCELSHFISEVSQKRILGRRLTWVFAPDGSLLVAPADSMAALPRNIYQNLKSSQGADNIVYSGYCRVGSAQEELLEIIYRVPPEISSTLVGEVFSRAIVIVIAVMLLSVVMAFFLSKHLSQPIIDLVQANRLFSQGNYEVQAAPKTGGEVGELARSFNEMATIIKERTSALREEKEASQRYLDVAAVIFVVMDRNHRITVINKKGCELLGYDEDELIGKNWFEIAHPRPITDQVKGTHRRLLSGEIEGVKYLENKVVTKTGEERLIAWHNNYVEDSHGVVIAIVGSGEDITERKQGEDALKASEARFRTLMDRAADAVFVSDLEGRLVNVNKQACKSLGYSEEELLAMSVPDIDSLFTRNVHLKSVWGELSVDNPISIQSLHRRKDGKTFPVEISIVKLEERGHSTIIGVARDISERKREELATQQSMEELERCVAERTIELKKTHEKLLHAEKLSAIGGLAASIAHEFNNPLQGVMTVIQGIRRRASFDEEDAELIDMSIDECNRMKDLIKSLQDFNRPTSGRVALMDIHACIDSLLILSKKEYSVKGITVEAKYAADMPQVMAVGDQIKQVLLNLLSNAVCACEGGGTITINTEVVGKDKITIKIQDTGKGIHPEHIEQIFDPFFTTKTEYKGTGLGLSISDGIIKKHGGRIDVESEPDKGATFTITLPVEEKRDA